MLKCPKCGASLEDGSAFCEKCGTKLPKEIICPVCGAKTTDDFAFCCQCGSRLCQEQALSLTDGKEEENNTEKWYLQKKWWIIGGAALLAVIAVIVLALVLRPKEEAKTLLYYQNYELYYTTTDKLEPGIPLTDNAGAAVSQQENLTGSYIPVAFNEEQQLVFYLDDRKVKDGTGTLYCRDLSRDPEDRDAIIKIDTGVGENFTLYYDNTLVLYLKESTKQLYSSDMKGNRQLIAEDVSKAVLSEDQKHIFYISGGNLYLCATENSNQRELLDTQITDVLKYTENFETICYLKDGHVYLKKMDEDKVQIQSSAEVDQVVALYEDGSFYYTSPNDNRLTLWDYVDDDVVPFENQKEPREEDFRRGNGSVDLEAYLEAKERYTALQGKELLRLQLKAEKLPVETKSLYYYDGQSDRLIAGQITSVEEWTEKKALLCNGFDPEGREKISLSGITSVDDAKEQLQQLLGQWSAPLYVSESLEAPLAIPMESGASSSFQGYFTEDGESVAYLDGDTLFRFSVGNGEGKTEMIDQGVKELQPLLTQNGKKTGKNYYTKANQEDPSKKDIYLDKNLIAQKAENLTCYDTSALYYTSTAVGEERTLYRWQNGGSQKISDKVQSYLLTSSNQLFFLKEEEENQEGGSLYRYENGSISEKIAGDVNGISVVQKRREIRQSAMAKTEE